MPPAKTKKRIWKRFSLRAFLICTTLLSLVIGFYIVGAKKQAKAVSWCLKHGGNVDYDSNYDFNKHTSGPASPEQQWHESASTRDYVSNVVQVRYTSQGSDPSTLKALTNLDMLVIYDAKQCDVEICDAFPKLKVLQLLGDGIDDLASLSNLTNIEQLGLAKLDVENLEPLGKLSLQSLIISDSNIQDFSALSNLTGLQLLIIKNTDISDEDLEELEAALPKCYFQIINRNGTVKRIAPQGG